MLRSQALFLLQRERWVKNGTPSTRPLASTYAVASFLPFGGTRIATRGLGVQFSCLREQ